MSAAAHRTTASPLTPAFRFATCSKFYITLPDGKRVRDLAHPFRCAVVSARVFVRFGWAILQPDELKGARLRGVAWQAR